MLHIKGSEKLVLLLFLFVSFTLILWKYSIRGKQSNVLGSQFIQQDPWAGVPAIVEKKENATIFYYKNEHNSKEKGRPMTLLDIYKKRFEWPPRKYVKLKNDSSLFSEYVFVTAASKDHYREMLTMLASVQELSPNTKIIVWDLGWNTLDFIEQIKSLCNVEYRKFDYSAYPPHVNYLHNYAFKPLVVTETMKDYPVAYWIDASIRFISTGDLSHVRPQLLGTGGILGMIRVQHSVYAATHPTLYTYLPPDMNKIKTVEMGGSGFVLFYQTEKVFKNVILFWVLCALTPDCTQPTKKLGCDVAKLRRAEYAGCHRFDQAVISLLMGNLYNFDYSLYRDRMAKSDQGDFVRVARGQKTPAKLKTCS